jgi:hypothetical protein
MVTCNSRQFRESNNNDMNLDFSYSYWTIEEDALLFEKVEFGQNWNDIFSFSLSIERTQSWAITFWFRKGNKSPHSKQSKNQTQNATNSESVFLVPDTGKSQSVFDYFESIWEGLKLSYGGKNYFWIILFDFMRKPLFFQSFRKEFWSKEPTSSICLCVQFWDDESHYLKHYQHESAKISRCSEKSKRI